VPTPAPAFQPRVHEAPASAAINQNHSSAFISEEAGEEEVASIKRVPAVTLQLWETLLRPRGFEINAGKLVRSPTKSQAGTGERDVEMSPLSAKTKTGRKGKEREQEGDVSVAGSVLSSFRRANSFAPPAVVTSAGPRQPFRRIASVIVEPGPNVKAGASKSPGRSRSGSHAPQDNVAGPSKPMVGAGTSSSLLFSGLRFKALGEARCANVRTEIEGCGGLMLSHDEETAGGEDVDYIVVRLVRYVFVIFSFCCSMITFY
jgi:DNA replication regulator DPB11